MLKVLFSLGNFPFFVYGVLITLGFFWALFFIWKYIRLTSYSEEKIFDLIFFSLLGAGFFGRLFYFLFNPDISFSFMRFILFNGYPGFSFYGALLGGVIFCFFWCLFKKYDFFEIMDYLSFGLLVFLVFLFLAKAITGEEGLTDYARRLFPSVEALYIGLFFSFLFSLGAFFSQRVLLAIRREKFFNGFNFLFMLWYSSLVYFSYSKLFHTRLVIANNSLNEIVSFYLLLTISILFVYYFRDKIFSSFLIFSKNVKKLFNQRRDRED